MRTHPFSVAVLLASLALAAWPQQAQAAAAVAPPPATPAAPAAPAAKQTFKAVVTVKHAVILAGASKAYYVIGHMDAGSILEVVDASYPGYYEILPPGCCAAFVAKDKVQADDKGAVGTVKEDGTDCFAAGLEMTPANSFRIMRKLAKGEALDILGVTGDYYRVEAPAKTTVFVPADQVRKATDKDLKDGPPEAASDYTPAGAKAEEKAAETKPESKPATGKTSPPPTQVSKDKPKPVTPVAPKEDDNALATDPALRAAEKRVEEAYSAAKDKAIPSAKLQVLLAEYRQLATRTDFNAVDGQLVAGRTAQLGRALKISENLEKAAAAEKAGLEAGAPPVTPTQVGYDAVGQIKASTIYDGSTLPKLYRLVNAEDALIAYVLPDAVDGALLNKLVGIQGDIETDPNLKVRVIHVRKAEALAADGKKPE